MENTDAGALGYGWAVLLGVVQGLTEFLPVSSSGHLALAQHWGLGRTEDLAFDVLLHVATLGVVAAAYARDWLAWWRGRRVLFLYLAAATLPAAAGGLLLKDHVERLRDCPAVIGVCFLLTAVVLWRAERMGRGHRPLDELGFGRAFVVGVCQLAALLPGVSRSGSTLAGGLGVGLGREDALRFSFALAVPVIGGAALLEGAKLARHPELAANVPWGPWLAGCAAAFVCGALALKALRWIALGGRLWVFSIYLAALGLFTVAWSLWF